MGSATWLGLFLRTWVDRLGGDRRRRLFSGGRLGLLDRLDVDGPTLRADVHGLASSCIGYVLHRTDERGGADKRSPIAHARLHSARHSSYWPAVGDRGRWLRSEEHTSELQSHVNLVCRLLLEKKKKINRQLQSTNRKKKTKEAS